MLTQELPAIGVRGFALTEGHAPEASPLELLGRAVDRTLAECSAEAVSLLLFSGFAFTGPRADSPWPGAQSALLDNELSATISRDVLQGRGLSAVQPHGVWLVEHLPLTSALRMARQFMLGEGLARVLVVACDVGGSGRMCAASCMLSLDAAQVLLATVGDAKVPASAADTPRALTPGQASWAARVEEVARWMRAPFDPERPTCDLTESHGQQRNSAAFVRFSDGPASAPQAWRGCGVPS